MMMTMNLSGIQRQGVQEAATNIRALCRLAAVNFPSPTDLRIAIDGSAASGSIRVSWTDLATLAKLAEEALAPSPDNGDALGRTE
jgi:type II secretory pathway component PulM